MAVSQAGVRLSIWMAVFTGLTTAVIVLRIWALHLTRKSLQLSDYLVFVAYVRVHTPFCFCHSEWAFRLRRM